MEHTFELSTPYLNIYGAVNTYRFLFNFVWRLSDMKLFLLCTTELVHADI